MLRHVLEMGDEGAIGACRHRGLVHVQGAGKTRLQLAPIQVAVLKPGLRLMGGRMDCRFLAANGWIEACMSGAENRRGCSVVAGPVNPLQRAAFAMAELIRLNTFRRASPALWRSRWKTSSAPERS